MADITNQNSQSNNAQTTQSGLSVGRLYIDQYNERNDPLNGVPITDSEAPATVKDVEGIVNAIKNSFADFIEIQRAYIDSDRSDNSSNENDNSGDELPKKELDEEDDIDEKNVEKTENSDLNDIKQSKNDENSEINTKNSSEQGKNSDLTIRAKNDIININEDSNDIQYEISKNNVSQDFLQPSFETNSLISEKILNDNETDESDSYKLKNDIESSVDEENYNNIISNSDKSSEDDLKNQSNETIEEIDFDAIRDSLIGSIYNKLSPNTSDDSEKDEKDNIIVSSNESEISDFKDNQVDIFSSNKNIDESEDKRSISSLDNIIESNNNEISSNIIDEIDEGHDDNENIKQNDSTNDVIEKTIVEKTIVSKDIDDTSNITPTIQPFEEKLINIDYNKSNIEESVPLVEKTEYTDDKKEDREDESIIGRIGNWFSSLFNKNDENDHITQDEKETSTEVEVGEVPNIKIVETESEQNSFDDVKNSIDFNNDKNSIDVKNLNIVEQDDNNSTNDELSFNDLTDVVNVDTDSSKKPIIHDEIVDDKNNESPSYNSLIVDDEIKPSFDFDRFFNKNGEFDDSQEISTDLISENTSNIENASSKLIDGSDSQNKNDINGEIGNEKSTVNGINMDEIKSILMSINNTVSENNSLMTNGFEELKGMLEKDDSSTLSKSDEYSTDDDFYNSKQTFELERIG